MLVQYISIVKKKVAQMDEKLEEAKQEIEYYKRRFEEQVRWGYKLATFSEIAARNREHHEHEIRDHYHSEPRIDGYAGTEENQNFKFEREIRRKCKFQFLGENAEYRRVSDQYCYFRKHSHSWLKYQPACSWNSSEWLVESAATGSEVRFIFATAEAFWFRAL